MLEGRRVRRIVIHHSEGMRDDFAAIRRWQTTPDDPATRRIEGRGWSDVAYHVVIEFNGGAFIGRPEAKAGWGTRAMSRDALEVCLCGDFDRQQPTPEQMERLRRVLAVWCLRHGLTPDETTIVGHRAIQPMKGAAPNRCPGAALEAALPALREAVAATMRAATPTPRPAAAG